MIAEEFTALAPSLPITFLPGGERPTPAFLTGFAPGVNAFVGEASEWCAAYVPAYLRR